MEKQKMMTLDELKNCKNLNGVIVREALSQVKELLEELRNSKNHVTQRSYILLNGFLLAITAATTVAYNVKDKPEAFQALGIFIIFSIIGLGFVVCSLWGFSYGMPGSDPECWLQEGTINAKTKTLDKILAYRVFYHQKKIADCKKSIWIIIILTRIAIISLSLGIIGAAIKILFGFCKC